MISSLAGIFTLACNSLRCSPAFLRSLAVFGVARGRFHAGLQLVGQVVALLAGVFTLVLQHVALLAGIFTLACNLQRYHYTKSLYNIKAGHLFFRWHDALLAQEPEYGRSGAATGEGTNAKYGLGRCGEGGGSVRQSELLICLTLSEINYEHCNQCHVWHCPPQLCRPAAQERAHSSRTHT
jgi:hypothetical protein